MNISYLTETENADFLSEFALRYPSCANNADASKNKNGLFIFISHTQMSKTPRMPRQPGAVFLINKITNPSSGNSRYPEILFRHPFNESGISDSEIFALYAAAERFFERKNIHFFICPADTENIKHVSEIKKWAQIRAQFEPDASHFRQNAAELTQSERDTAEKVITQLKLTQTQRHDFLRCLVNCKLRGGFPEAEISEFAFANPAGKKERSAVYDKLKQKLNFIDY